MNKERLGAFIAGERKTLGLTQRDLAARLHVTDKAVSKWERGLSYPDVTLLEPLAAALDLGVEELMACRRQAVRAEREDETMKALLDISSDSVRTEKRRGWGRLTAVLALLLATALGIFCAVTFRSAQGRDLKVKLKETVNGVNYLYIEEPGNAGHLLRLKCGGGVDFDAIQPRDEGGWENSFDLSYRWNRWTRTGTLTACEGSGFFLGGMGAYEADCEPLFGYPQVFCLLENYYPDPYSEPRGRGFLCDARFWVEKDGQPLDTGMLDEVMDGGSPYPEDIKKTILVVEDCLNATIADVDGDGENEVVVRTRWAEKPYTVYDMVDGEIVETWPDTVPDEVVGRLWCVWEQQEAMEWSAKHG